GGDPRLFLLGGDPRLLLLGGQLRGVVAAAGRRLFGRIRGCVRTVGGREIGRRRLFRCGLRGNAGRLGTRAAALFLLVFRRSAEGERDGRDECGDREATADHVEQGLLRVRRRQVVVAVVDVALGRDRVVLVGAPAPAGEHVLGVARGGDRTERRSEEHTSE